MKAEDKIVTIWLVIADHLSNKGEHREACTA